jgi:hypothetical protein
MREVINLYETLYIPQIHPRGILSPEWWFRYAPQKAFGATQPPCWNVS